MLNGLLQHHTLQRLALMLLESAKASFTDLPLLLSIKVKAFSSVQHRYNTDTQLVAA
jgi:hypothetical protein